VTLTVFVDFAAPAARLAITPTVGLAHALGIVPDWRPYPIARRDAMDARGDRAARHARVRADYRRAEQAWYAAAQGVALEAPPGPAWAANAALLWANRQGVGQAWVERAFDAVWSGRLDPDDGAAVATALAGCCSVEGFERWLAHEAEQALEASRTEALLLGAPEVPAYVVDTHVFVGREHLPMIRWLIEGSLGEAPA
jgi:2-hydroxychromene-2-carboxylate isomerase